MRVGLLYFQCTTHGEILSQSEWESQVKSTVVPLRHNQSCWKEEPVFGSHRLLPVQDAATVLGKTEALEFPPRSWKNVSRLPLGGEPSRMFREHLAAAAAVTHSGGKIRRNPLP